MAKVKESFPDLLNAETEAAKAMETWQKKYIGTYDAEGNVVDAGIMSKDLAVSLLARPFERASLFYESFQSSQVAELETKLTAAKANEAEYKKQLNIIDSPENSSSALSSKQSKKELSADDMLVELQAMSAG